MLEKMTGMLQNSPLFSKGPLLNGTNLNGTNISTRLILRLVGLESVQNSQAERLES